MCVCFYIYKKRKKLSALQIAYVFSRASFRKNLHLLYTFLQLLQVPFCTCR